MATGTIAFLLGVVALQLLPVLPDAFAAVLLPLAALALLPFRRRHSRLVLLLLLVLAGFGWAWLRAAMTLADTLPAALEGQDLLVEGVVSALPEQQARRLRFEFLPDRMQHQGRPFPFSGRLRLAWYEQAPDLKIGERWRLTVRLKQPHGMANPHSFDYEAWLFGQGLRATGYVRQREENRRLAPAGGYPVQRARERLRDLQRQALGDHPRAGLIAALTLGERDGIDSAQWKVLTATGTNHLMAISGLHVGLVAGLAFALGWRLWPARWCLRVPAPQAASAVALLAALGYALLAGLSVPTQRALVMVAVVAVAVLGRRSVHPLGTLSTALLAVLLLDPLAVLSPGFWLSFGAVAVLLYGMSGRLAPRGWLWRWGRAQGLVALGLLAPLVMMFGLASWSAPLANLFAVPWVGLLVVPAALGGTLLLPVWADGAEWLLRATAELMEWLWRVLAWLAEVAPPFAWGEPPAWAVAAALVGTAWLLAPRGWPARALGLLWLLPLLAWSPARPPPGEVWATLLDVGQGLSGVVETAHHTLVFDTGPRLGADLDAGSAVLVPFLRGRGVGRVDTLVLSHGDGDHAGGLDSLLDAVPIARLHTTSIDHQNRPGATDCGARTWQWDGVSFQLTRAARLEENDGSCVLRVVSAAGALLLPGDIEALGEERLMAQGESLRSQVVVAPHHGSLTSSSPRFVEAVAPTYVLYSVGHRNRFGFPHPEVAARYRALGAIALETAGSGAIRVVLPAEGEPGLTPWRAQYRRYWHWRPAH